MKVVFPKNIQKGFLAGMSFQIGPITLSIAQLFVVGVGVAAAMSVFNSLSNLAGKVVWTLFAIIVLLIFVFIGFFKVSELSLIPFVAKIIRNMFFDTNRKFQVNYDKFDPVKISIKRSKSEDKEQTVFEQKESKVSKETVDKMNAGGLL